MRRFLLIAFTTLSINLIAQTNLLPPDGSVGIGTTNPQAKLHVVNSISGFNKIISINSTSGRDAGDMVGIGFNSEGYGVWSKGGVFYERTGGYGIGKLHFMLNSAVDPSDLSASNTKMTIDNTGNVGIGTTTPHSKLDIGVIHALNQNEAIRIGSYSGTNTYWGLGLNYRLDNVGNPTGHLVGYEGSTSFEALSINLYNKKVGIGTSNPDELLTVNGIIHAKEVKIDLSGPLSDFVFKPTYKLMPLPEVEQFVKTNSHLPEIPSANEITKNGLSMGEMQNKLLQKVEELTLYAIQQNKEIVEQRKDRKELEAKLSKQENQYNALLEKVEMLTKQIEKR